MKTEPKKRLKFKISNSRNIESDLTSLNSYNTILFVIPIGVIPGFKSEVDSKIYPEFEYKIVYTYDEVDDSIPF